MRVFPLMLAAVCLTAGSAAAFDVTTCRTRVPQGEIGVLRNDIDCSSIAPTGDFSAVVLERNAVLDLNGFTIDHYSTYLLSGVECRGKCEIRGPGRLLSSNLNAGVNSFMRNPVTISDVDFEGQITGVNTPYTRTVLRNVTMHVADTGVTAKKLLVDGVQIEVGPGGSNCIDTSYSTGSSVTGSNVMLLGCDVGIGNQGSIDLANLTVVDAATYGVFARKKLRLTDSSITGSPIDIVSGKLPLLVNTTCGRSAVFERRDGVTNESFGVCAND